MSQRLEYKKFRKGETCEQERCGSRYYYIQDGRAYCKNHDHIQESYRQVEADEDDFNTQGRKTRTKREEAEKVAKVLTGKEARELFMICWQFILRKQLWWLTRSREEGGAGLPGELEDVVRGLCALRLRTLVDEKVTEELGFSSQTEIDSGDDTSGSEMTRNSSRGRRQKGRGPRLIESLALCYLGTVLMKLPISVAEFYNWAVKEDIVYIRAIRFVPKEMKSKLNSHFQAALDTRSPLKPDSLHRAILRLSVMLDESAGLRMPPINYRLLTFHHVTKLGLPLEIYQATHHLASLLSIPFNFPSSSATRLSISQSPEIKLACLIIIAVKLAYPFSSPSRYPTSATDPAIFKMDWEAWRSVMKNPDRGKKRGDGKGLVKGQEITVTEEEVFRMNGKELDDYLDWYGRTFIEGDDEEQKFPVQILRLFPLESTSTVSERLPGTLDSQTQGTSSQPAPAMQPPAIPPKIKSMHKYLEYRKPSKNKDSTPAGSRYFHYRTVPELPENAKAFYEVVANQTSISLESLTQAVFIVERRLVEWMITERRKEVSADSDYSDDLVDNGDLEEGGDEEEEQE